MIHRTSKLQYTSIHITAVIWPNQLIVPTHVCIGGPHVFRAFRGGPLLDTPWAKGSWHRSLISLPSVVVHCWTQLDRKAVDLAPLFFTAFRCCPLVDTHWWKGRCPRSLTSVSWGCPDINGKADGLGPLFLHCLPRLSTVGHTSMERQISLLSTEVVQTLMERQMA